MSQSAQEISSMIRTWIDELVEVGPVEKPVVFWKPVQ